MEHGGRKRRRDETGRDTGRETADASRWNVSVVKTSDPSDSLIR